MKTRDCPRCAGDGFDYETCAYCRGNGGQGCKHCSWNGDIKVECMDCHGTGLYMPEDEFSGSSGTASAGIVRYAESSGGHKHVAHVSGSVDATSTEEHRSGRCPQTHAGTGVENGKPAQDPTAKRSPSELLHGGMGIESEEEPENDVEQTQQLTGRSVPSARTPERHLLGGAPVCSAVGAPPTSGDGPHAPSFSPAAER